MSGSVGGAWGGEWECGWGGSVGGAGVGVSGSGSWKGVGVGGGAGVGWRVGGSWKILEAASESRIKVSLIFSGFFPSSSVKEGLLKEMHVSCSLHPWTFYHP